MEQLAFDMADVTAKRHRGNPESVEANRRAAHSKGYWRAQVVLFAAQQADFTLKELCRFYGKQLHDLSGRISELKQDRILTPTGRRREGCAVLRLAARAEEQSNG